MRGILDILIANFKVQILMQQTFQLTILNTMNYGTYVQNVEHVNLIEV